MENSGFKASENCGSPILGDYRESSRVFLFYCDCGYCVCCCGVIDQLSSFTGDI